MATVAGVTTGENRGLVLTSLNFTAAQGPASFAPLKGLEVYLGNYYVPDVFNTLYLNPEYRHDFTDDWHLRFGVQYFDQRSVGSELLGGFSTWQVGARTEVGWRGLGVPGDDVGHGAPTPAFARRTAPGPDISRCSKPTSTWPTRRPGKSASPTTGASRPSRPVKVPGLWTSLLYAEGFDIKAQAQDVPVGKRREARSLHRLAPPAAARVPLPLPQLPHPRRTDKAVGSFYRFPDHPGPRRSSPNSCEP